MILIVFLKAPDYQILTLEIMRRRSFIKKSALGSLAALSLTGRSAHGRQTNNNTPAAIKEYRRLGRTEARVSDIGSGEPTSESVLRAVLDAGVNFIETSETHANGRNETMIGRVIKDYPRNKVFIATKVNFSYRFFRSESDIISRAEESLRRLDTDYIDLYMVHQAQNIVRVKDKNFHNAARGLKREGRIRFTGLSCHGPTWGPGERDSLEDILMSAINDGRYDVIFLPYNFLNPEAGERILEACRKNDIGTMIMKANPVVLFDDYESILKRGGELSRSQQNDYERIKEQMDGAAGFFSKYGLRDIEKIKEAAIQFILSNRNVGTICCRFENFSDVEKYVSLSGTQLGSDMSNLLSDFRQKLGFLNCRIGCNACEQICPQNVAVNTIMRYSYYYHTQRREKAAMKYYSELAGGDARGCKDCAGMCEKACPFGVAVQPLIIDAHEKLTIS